MPPNDSWCTSGPSSTSTPSSSTASRGRLLRGLALLDPAAREEVVGVPVTDAADQRDLAVLDRARCGRAARARSFLAQRLERRPARIAPLLVHVRLVVQILPADGAEPGAVAAAEDLRGERRRDRVARPLRELQLPVDTYSVRSRPAPSAVAWYSRASIATSTTASPQAPHARPVQPRRRTRAGRRRRSSPAGPRTVSARPPPGTGR